MKKLLFIILLMSCDKPEHCYQCHSPVMPDITFCGYTDEDMRSVIHWRAENLGDTLRREIIEQ